MIIALYGASGFMGNAIRQELSTCAEIVPIAAPRLKTSASSPAALLEEAARIGYALPATVDIVVNAAGLAAPTDGNTDRLNGANALLPLVLARAARHSQQARLVHVSSAAVQGRISVLDETARWFPETAYARSKALAEESLLTLKDVNITILRPTSVHGVGRPITERLQSIARGPLATVANPGTDPTPQVHVSSVSRTVKQILHHQGAPRIVLQPSDGLTTSQFLALLSGKEPRLMPRALAHSAVRSAYLAARTLRSSYAASQARRAELMLFGQPQKPGWLRHQSNVHAHQAWQDLAP